MCLYFIASLTDPGYVDTAQYKQVGQVRNLVIPSASNLWGGGLVILKLTLYLVFQSNIHSSESCITDMLRFVYIIFSHFNESRMFLI